MTLLPRIVTGLAATLFVGAACATPPPPEVGDTFPDLRLTDQHEQPHRVDRALRYVVFARDMAGNRIVREAFEGVTADLLVDRQVAIVADIHRMPGIVTRLFALPALRKRTYPIWLDRDGEPTAGLPYQEEHITLFELEARLILSERFIADSAALRAALFGDMAPALESGGGE